MRLTVCGKAGDAGMCGSNSGVTRDAALVDDVMALRLAFAKVRTDNRLDEMSQSSK